MTAQGNTHSSKEESIDDELTAGETVDLHAHLKTILKYRWSILLTVAICTVTAALFATNIAPTFRATTTLHIESQQTLPLNLDSIIGIDTDNGQYYQTQLEALKSKSLARRVIREMALVNHPELSPPTPDSALATATAASRELQERKAIDRFIKRTTVLPIKNTKMVRISFDSNDPVFAARVANKITDTYIVSYTDSRTATGEKANTLLTRRMEELKIELENSQKRLFNYKETQGLVDIQGDNTRLSEQEIGIITNKLLEAENAEAYAKILYDEVVRTREAGIDALLSLPLIDTNEMVRRHKIALHEAQLELDELSNRYGEKHPRVIDAVSRQDSARSSLYSQLNNLVDSIEKDYQLNQQKTASLQAKLNEGKKQLQDNDRTNLELMHLQREVALNQEVYDAFYTRSREVIEAENINTSNAQVVEYAEAPLNPVSPKKTLITLLVFLLSTAAAILVAIVRESTNNTVNRTTDVEHKLGVKMLGILPLASTGTGRKARPTTLLPGSLTHDSHAFEESVRTIRTSVCLDELQKSNQVILVTSALPSEGKSTLACHLAQSFSNLEKVLLIECDLRRPCLHTLLELPDNKGLTQLLNREAEFSTCLKPSVIGNLDVLPAGTIPNKPLDLLSSPRFNRLLQLMRSRYDRIIIDSAPVQAVSDALILGRLTDSVIFTVKANSTSIAIASRAMNRLREAGISLSGAVVSQVNLRKNTVGDELNFEGYYDYYGYTDLNNLEEINEKESTATNKAA